MTRPDIDAIRARCDAATRGPWSVSTLTFPNGNTVVESIAGVSEPQWSDYGDGEGEWFTDRLTLVETDAGHYGPTMPDAQFIAAARTDIPALLAYVDELEREIAILRPWSVMLKRAHGALTDAGCVVPLEFDQSIEHAIKDLARRATRAEQLFVDEYDARRDVERQRDELQARIAVLEAMR